MARRAGRALAASLALAAIGLPAALLASQTAASAAPGKRFVPSQATIAITSMTPQQASPGATIKVTGTLTNNTKQQLSGVSVQLLGSNTAVTDPAELEPGSAGQDQLADTPVPHGALTYSGPLTPGSSRRWSIQVKANSIGMTRFGVYPLTVQASAAQLQLPLAATTTFLPYVPARKGPYASSIPARTKISWVLPLIDKPLLDQPWQNICLSPAAPALVASLGSAGRLGQLVGAGADSAGTADALSVAARSARTGDDRAVRSQSAQSLSSYDGVTWAIDPALLANVKALATCGSAQPRWAAAARNWLAELRQVTSAEPVFVTPYGDPDIAALVSDGLQPDVQRSFQLGQQVSQKILLRNIGSLVSTNRAYGAVSQAAGVAWPADGADYSTVEYLAPKAGISTLLLSSAARPAQAGESTVVQVTNGVGGDMNVLFADQALTQLLASSGTAGSTFAGAQDFLALTALAAQQDNGSPVIVAPPRRFDPASGLTYDLLAETASASWLSPASLTSLTAVKHIPQVASSSLAIAPGRIGKHELRKLNVVDSEIQQLQSIAANQADFLALAVATVESSAWRGKSRASALTMLRTVRTSITQQEAQVRILAEPRVTLGGLKGNVPVSIDNGLGYAVKVKLQLRYSDATGIKITTSSSGPIVIQKHTALTVKLHVQAAEVGSTSVTLSLTNTAGLPLAPGKSESMTIEATQVGVLGAIIGAAAIGIFLIAYAFRAVRRSRPASAAGQPARLGPAADQSDDQSAEPAEPDTVMAERTELGTAGAPGP
jgi:hypothetical protein